MFHNYLRNGLLQIILNSRIMANKITTVNSSDVWMTNRFEPKMFIFQSVLKKCQKKYPFVVLGDEKFATGIKRGQSPKPETYRDKRTGKYIFIRTADVKKYHINTESSVYLEDDTFATQKNNRVISDDILISVVGNYLGSTSVIPENIDMGAFNDNSARIRIVDKNISPYYVSAVLNSSFGQQLILSLATRTGQKILSAGNVKKISLPIFNNNRSISQKYRKAVEKEMESNILIAQAQQLFYSCFGAVFKSVSKENEFSVKKSNFAKADLWTPMYSYPLYVNTVKAIQGVCSIVDVGTVADLIKGDEVGSDNYIGYIEKRKTDIPFVRTTDIVNYEVDQYPDFFIPKEIFDELDQGFQSGDVLFTKDGKIGVVGMLTKSDKAIISSGFAGLRLNKKGRDLGLTSEYLFLALSIKEIGGFASKRRTVVASTIPHLREERLKEIEIPILDKNVIGEISELVRRAFELKDEKKCLIEEMRQMMEGYFEL